MFAHVHVGHWHWHPHLHTDMRRLARDAVIAAELGAASVLVVSAVERNDGASSGAAPEVPIEAEAAGVSAPAITVARHGAVTDASVLTALPGAHPRVELLDATGAPVTAAELGEGPVRLAVERSGVYELVVHQQTPVSESGDVGLSSALVLRSEPFAVGAGETVVVSIA